MAKKKKKWIQKARNRMKRKGTIGSFTKYCGGKVTDECIRRALKSKDPRIRKKAAFAKAMRSIHRKEHGGYLEDIDNIDVTQFALGGDLLSSVIGGLGSGMANAAISVLGSLLKRASEKDKAIQGLDSSLNTVNAYENGGYIEGTKDTFKYRGPDHDNGGIKVNIFGQPVSESNQEVEGDEVGVILDGKRYIFSKKLVI